MNWFNIYLSIGNDSAFLMIKLISNGNEHGTYNGSNKLREMQEEMIPI